ncbi:MAG: hypothetical protein RR348_06495 [Clostridia bacterium]
MREILFKENTIYSFDEFADNCKYFYCDEDAEIYVNNGYNCKHPAQEEISNNVGCCYRHSCPLCYPIDEEDFENPKNNKNGFTEFEENDLVMILGEEEVKE